MKRWHNTLIQISDCHIADNQDTGIISAEENLQKIIHKVNQNAVDAVLISGDLSHNGTPQSYQLLKRYLQALKIEPFLLAGNHDNDDNLKQLFAQNLIQNFTLGCWQILIINSVQQQQTAGFLSKQTLSKLAQSLKNTTAKYNIIALHHPVVPLSGGWDNTLSLQNPDDFFNTIAPYPKIKAVLWGHAHQAACFKKEKMQLFSCPSSAKQFNNEKRIGYNQYRLFDDGNLEGKTIWL